MMSLIEISIMEVPIKIIIIVLNGNPLLKRYSLYSFNKLLFINFLSKTLQKVLLSAFGYSFSVQLFYTVLHFFVTAYCSS